MHFPWQIASIIIIFLAPIFLSAAILFTAPSFNTTQHGTFVSPAQYFATPGKWRLYFSKPEIHSSLTKLVISLGAEQDRITVIEDQQVPHDKIYLIDPKGLFVMFYQSDSNLSYLQKDIRKMLKYSHD